MKREGVVEIQVSVCHSYMVHWNSPIFYQVFSGDFLAYIDPFFKTWSVIICYRKRSFEIFINCKKVPVPSGKVSQASLFAWLARVRSVSVTLWTQWSCLTRGSRQTRIPLVGGQMKDTPENSVSHVHIRLKSFKGLLRLNYVQVKSLLCLQFSNFKGEKHK